ncbi:MAG: hypothetical protein RIC55_06870 [Pirellulaceae bacterium]
MKSANFSARRGAVLWMAIGALIGNAGELLAQAAGDKPKVERPYGDGPLSLEDFGTEPPAGTTRGAKVYANINFEHVYRSFASSPGKRTAFIQSVEVRADVLRWRSWIFDRQQREALAYPQGHYDIDQLLAKKCQRAMYQKLADGEQIFGVGASEQEAVGEMEKRLSEIMEPVVEDRADLHHQYDEATDGGADAQAIEASRKETLRQLAEIEKELKKLAAAALRRSRRR